MSLDSVAGQEEDVYSTEPATDTSSIPDTGSFSQGSSGRAVSEGRWSNSGLMEPPDFPIGLEETASRLLHHNVTESEDISVPQNLGKRSAVDACLSDTEENEKRMICRTVPPSDEPRNVSTGSSSFERDAPGFPIGLLDNANNRVNKHRQEKSHKPSFITRRVRSTDRHASESESTESQLDDPGVASHGANDTKVSNIGQSDGNIDSAPQDGGLQVDGGPIFTPTSGAPEALSEIGFDFGEILNPQSKVASDELLNSDTDEESQIGVDANSPGLPSLEESSKNDLQPTISSTTDKRGQESSAMNDSVTVLDAGTTSRFSAPASNGSFILSTETKPTLDDEDVGNPKLSTPMKPLQTINPSTPISDSRIVVSVTELGDEDPFENPTAASENSPTTEGRVIEDEVCEDFGSPTPVKLPKFKAPALPDKKNASMGSFEQPSQPMQEPRLDLFNGILVISNPLYGNLSTYKVTITVQVELQRGRIGGWNRLRVPGLPRMKNGENGWFLFQMPDYLGMEFQTTNFGRHNFIEDCFFAELVQCGDLVVPLRLCLRSFYGTVRDFTVDQEIMSEHVTHKRTQNLALVYNAMCSLRLYKHCFWAERCRFYLWIDGGPEGDYHCEVDPSTESPAFLCLPSNDRPIGVSCIQIVCSPKDLGAFCLSWCAECRCEEGLEWLPRIYSAPVLVPGRNGHGLRETLSSLSSNFITKTILDPLDVRKGDIGRGFPQTAGPNNHTAVQTKSRQESVSCLPLQKRMIFRRRFIPVTMVFALILLGLAVIHQAYSESMDFVRNPTLFSNSTLGFEFWTRARAANEEHHSVNAFHTHEVNFSEEDGGVHKVSKAGEDRTESATPDVEHKMDDRDKPESEMTAPERKLSWRDRLDYFLGWEGLAKRPAKRQISG